MMEKYVLLIVLQFVLVVTVSGDEITEPETTVEGPPTCAKTDEECSAHDDCCDNKCQAGMCAACTPDGAKCHKDGDCCDHHKCVMFKCQGCIPNGSHCTLSGECCSKDCDSEKMKCNKPPAPVVSSADEVLNPKGAAGSIVPTGGAGIVGGAAPSPPRNAEPTKGTAAISTFNPVLFLFVSIVLLLK